jgi:tripartite-type tricarboxylate transporter receptor subunit TctC
VKAYLKGAKTMKKLSLMVAVAMLFLVTGEMICAEKKSEYPQKPINYLIEFAAGGKVDTQMRGILPYVEKYLGGRFIIQNIPGAGGRIGYTKLFKAAPDGYTIGSIALTTVVGEFLTSVQYKSKDFTPIFACNVSNSVLLVPKDTYNSVEALINANKSKSLSTAIPGIGTSLHLVALVATSGLGLKDLKFVPFDSAASLAALAGKHIDFAFAVPANALPLVRAGMIKPLLVIADKRDKAFPEVPIPRELGYKISSFPSVDGIAGPPNMPAAKVKILEQAFAKAAADPKYLSWAEKAKMDIIPMDHNQFGLEVGNYIKVVEKYKDLLKD